MNGLNLIGVFNRVLSTGGRNGYGAKLCNIFSTKFTVDTACLESRQCFKQVSLNRFMHVEQKYYYKCFYI